LADEKEGKLKPKNPLVVAAGAGAGTVAVELIYYTI
jgi:hypothetical protein